MHEFLQEQQLTEEQKIEIAEKNLADGFHVLMRPGIREDEELTLQVLQGMREAWAFIDLKRREADES